MAAAVEGGRDRFIHMGLRRSVQQDRLSYEVQHFKIKNRTT
jgi:hypothetical protein